MKYYEIVEVNCDPYEPDRIIGRYFSLDAAIDDFVKLRDQRASELKWLLDNKPKYASLQDLYDNIGYDANEDSLAYYCEETCDYKAKDPTLEEFVRRLQDFDMFRSYYERPALHVEFIEEFGIFERYARSSNVLKLDSASQLVIGSIEGQLSSVESLTEYVRSNYSLIK